MDTRGILTALLIGLTVVATLALAGCPSRGLAEGPPGVTDVGTGEAAEQVPVEEADPQPAPDFALKAPGGAQVTLADYEGKILVLDFWATNCTGCIEEMPEFRAMYEDWDHERVEYLAVSLDTSIEVVEKFREDRPDLDLPMALADNQMLQDYLGARLAIPQSRVIGPDGLIRYKFGPGPSAAQVGVAVTALLAEADTADQATDIDAAHEAGG